MIVSSLMLVRLHRDSSRWSMVAALWVFGYFLLLVFTGWAQLFLSFAVFRVLGCEIVF